MHLRALRFGGTIALLLVTAVSCNAKILSSAPILPGTYATVVIGDIPGLFDKAGALGSKIIPGFTADAIKQQAGSILGDPQLSGLPPGSGIALLLPQDGAPMVFLEVAPAKLADYRKMVDSHNAGSGGIDQAEGLLIVTLDKSSLGTAKGLAARVQSDILSGPGASTVLASLKLTDLMAKYDQQLQQSLEALSQKIGQANQNDPAPQAQSAVTFLKVYFALLKKLKMVEAEIQPSADGLSMSWSLTPAAEVGAASATHGTVTGAAYQKYLPGTGAVREQWDMDPQQIGAAFGAVLNEFQKQTGALSDTTSAVLEIPHRWADIMTGSGALTYMQGTGAPLSGGIVCGVRDEQKAIKLVDDTASVMNQSAVKKLYSDSGMDITTSFTRNAREYKGVPIHHLKIVFDFSRMSPEQRRGMMLMMGNANYEVAAVKNTLILAKDPPKIDTVIDAVQSGQPVADTQPLISATTLPSGGSIYLDYNIGTIMGMSGAIPVPGKENELMHMFSETIKDAPPLRIALYPEGQKQRVLLNIPANTILSFVQAGQKLQQARMEMMMQNGGKQLPPGFPDQMPANHP